MKHKHETYVDLETAKLLKEAGFDWECMCYYSVNTLHEPNNGFIHIYKQYKALFYDHNRTKMPVYSAPTLAVAQKWLREEKCVDVLVEKRFCAYVFSLGNLDDRSEKVIPQMSVGYDTYEEALEAGIKKCLILILEKNE